MKSEGLLSAKHCWKLHATSTLNQPEGVGTAIISVLQMRKLRDRDISGMTELPVHLDQCFIITSAPEGALLPYHSLVKF